MPEQCAVGPDGTLLPASKILFHNDPDDAIQLMACTVTTSVIIVTSLYSRLVLSKVTMTPVVIQGLVLLSSKEYKSFDLQRLMSLR